MVSLNELNDSLLPNIHHLFDHITIIDGNVNQSQLLHHDSHTNQMTNQPVIALSSATTSIPAVTENTTGTICKCDNCGWIGHTNKTCFQPGGKMEGCQEEYLVNRPIKTQVHLTSAEEVQEKEITVDTLDELVLTQGFTAMSLTHTNDINFASYPLLSTNISPCEENLDHVVFATLPDHFNIALDSACTNHIVCDHSLFQTYDTNSAVPVRTANCGFLTTLAIGNVKFCIVRHSRTAYMRWMYQSI